MARIEESWSSFANIDADSDHAKRIRAVLQNANFDCLCSLAAKTRQAQTDDPNPAVCTVDTSRFASGSCHVVLALSLPGGLQWVARIQLPLNDRHDDEKAATFLLSEVATMRLIRDRTTIPIPTVFGYDASTTNFGYRYILMEALPGQVLNSRMASSVPDTHKEKFASQLADYFYQLSTIRFNQVGRLGYSRESTQHEILPFSVPASSNEIGPLNTSFEYFYRFCKEHTSLVLQDHAGEREWEAAARLLESAVTSMITEEHIHGPFPLCHIEFHYNNILVDDELGITGLIDWSHAQTVPVERFAMIPEFVAPPAAPIETKQAIANFREIFIKALAKIQIERDGLQSAEEATLSRLFSSPRS